MAYSACLVLTGAFVIVASTAQAAPSGFTARPEKGVDYQQRARDLATQKAAAAYQKYEKSGPMTVAVKELPSTARRGDNVTVGNSTYSWRGTVGRGTITVQTKIPNGKEQVEQKRGFFRNVATYTRQTEVKGPDGTKVTTGTVATTKRAFWGGQIKRTETVIVAKQDTRTQVDVAHTRATGLSVTAQAYVLKPGAPWMTGNDHGAEAKIKGPQGKTVSGTVTNLKVVNALAEARNDPKPWRFVRE